MVIIGRRLDKTDSHAADGGVCATQPRDGAAAGGTTP